MIQKSRTRTPHASRREGAPALLRGRLQTRARTPRRGKGLIRALDRVGSRSDRRPAVARRRGPAHERTLCGGCGAVFARKTWRRSAPRLREALAEDRFPGVCPACRQAVAGQAFGRVVLQGTYVAGHAGELLRRIRNVAARAAFTQPERRLLGITARGATIEVLTTSQKLAHRIARELRKAFQGGVSYDWSDEDGRLLAVWRRDA